MSMPLDLEKSLEEEDQQLRYLRAESTEPLEIDKEAECGLFRGSAGEEYHVSLTQCDCIDFLNRGEPCKHIYRLALDLGVLEDGLVESEMVYDDHDWETEYDYAQRLRYLRAEGTTPLEIDKETECGLFRGSAGEEYHVSLTQCDCIDFLNRGEPCKHIYRLALELGEKGEDLVSEFSYMDEERCQ